jgi:zinc protease
VAWRSPDRPDRPDRDALVVAYRILDTRIREEIREKRGLAYSPWCDYDFGWYLWGTSTLSAGATVDPERADETVKQIRAVFERFAETGPTDEEVATARKQLETSIRTDQREPGYWLDRLSQLDLRGRTIEEHAGMLSTLLSFSAADLRAVAHKYIRPDRRFVVVSVPRRLPVAARH